jgi:hypothetical protein
MAAIQVPPAAVFFPVTALTVIFAAAMAHPVSRGLGILVGLLPRLAKLVEIDDLGHAFTPPVNFRIV